MCDMLVQYTLYTSYMYTCGIVMRGRVTVVDKMYIVHYIAIVKLRVCSVNIVGFFFKLSNNQHIPSRKKNQAVVQQTIGITDNVAVHQCAHYMHYSMYYRAYGPRC